MDIAQKIRQELEKRKLATSLLLFLVNAKDYNESNVELVNYLSKEKGLTGVYVTVNKPYKTLQQALQDVGVNTKGIFFIDAVSKLTSDEPNKSEGCVFIGSPQDLTGISIAITEVVAALPASNRFLIFDSLSTLLIYNPSSSVAKFAHFLTANIRKWGILGILILMGNEKEQGLVNELAQFCDATLDLSGGN